LEEIDEQNWEYAHRLFQCVAAASRPLRAEELAEFLAFDFKAGSTPEFLTDWRSEDPESEVLSICSTLLVVVQQPSGSPILQFAHFSVKEYLTSTRLAETKETISRFHISMTPAHIIVAQACLGVLLHLDENITEDRLKDFPLAEYAAKHWVHHVRFENVSSMLQDGMKRLFDPSQSHFSVWVWIYDPEPEGRLERYQRPSCARATPLHYATFYGMQDIATFLIVERSQDVNALGFHRKETPLIVSSRLGYVEMVQVLLKHGADTEARDIGDYTAMVFATVYGYVEVAQVLLEHGADTNLHYKKMCTPLHWASCYGPYGQLASAQVLLSHGADVTAQDEDNETALHVAKDEKVARLLLEHGSDANALDIYNRTPLHLVSEEGHVGVARALLEHGADVNARDANNETPLYRASWLGYSKETGLDMVRLLLQYGSDIHARDDEGRTPFMAATKHGRHEIMQFLLENGAEDHRV
jgi:ankyrin repeat protein